MTRDIERHGTGVRGERMNLGYYCFWLTLVLLVGAVHAAAAASSVRVQVAEPYLELHTGPGRGFPVFHVIERGEWVEMLGRQTDWFKIRTAKGIEGWSPRPQLEKTLTEAGIPTTFRDTLIDDFLRRRVEAGFSVGGFEGDPLLVVHAGYRFSDNLGVELTYSQAAGDFSSTRLAYVSLVSQPFPEWRIAPFFSIGLGRFRNVPKPTLISAIEVESNLANAGLGAYAYLTQRFMLRADYRRHVAFIDENRMSEFNEISLGMAFFFY
jgi:hypothetical protein